MRVDKRNETLSALQALALLNNGFMVAMAEHFAERIAKETSDRPTSRCVLLFRLALCRAPTDDEQQALAAYAKEHGLPNACRVMFNLNEFVFVD